MLTEKLMQITLAGGSEWVMVLLLVLSVLSIAVIAERALFFRNRRQALDHLEEVLRPLLGGDDLRQLRESVTASADPALNAAIQVHKGCESENSARIVAGELHRERLRLDRRLTFLGTLGNNAPFIGLFGTVLGIIRAFHDLSRSSITDHTSVMSGISEALVATALGLFVAIPAVIAFNYFQKQVDHTLSITESLAQSILATAPTGGDPTAQEKKGQ